jgi:phage terminase large subunit-like protein
MSPRKTTTTAPRSRTSEKLPADPVTQFASDVVAGLIVSGPDVRMACRRHLDDLEHAPQRGLTWDIAAALRAINFFPDVLRLNGGEFEGVAFHLLPWQGFIVGSLFGWKRKDGTRRFREAYVESGKGSGKSPLAAGIGLYMLLADSEPRAEVYAAATRRDQAMVLFRDAVAMVDLSPRLSQRLKKSGRGERVYNLADMDTGSWFRPIASDKDGQSGPRPHCALIDEVHEHRDPTVIDIMQAGKKGRRQPLIFLITNSGFDRTSLCYQKHEYGVRVCKGELEDDAFFAFVCSLDEEDDPFVDEACWLKANPSLGLTIKDSYLREQVRQAKGMPALESTVRRLNFCQWVDAANPWIDGELWRACEEHQLTIADFHESSVFGGLDLSTKNDLTALAAARRNPDDSVDAFVQFFTPADTMSKRDLLRKTHYVEWAREGHVIATPGKIIKTDMVAARLGELMAVMHWHGVAYDTYHIEYFLESLDALGIEMPIVPHGQGYAKSSQSGLWMPHSVELLEQLVLQGRLRVVFNPCLRWNSSNAVTETDAKGNRVFTKRKSAGRIDGLVALCMAVGLAFASTQEENIDDFLNDPVFSAV